MAKEIVLSILIPTFNRAPYLNNLLNYLNEEIYNLDFTYEIVVSDNASTDNSKEVIESFQKDLSLDVYFQKKNLGFEGTFDFILSRAKGKYFIYLADDDLLDFELLNIAVSKFEVNSNAVALYTPWQIWDYKNDKSICLFYNAPEITIKKDNFYGLGEFIFKNKVFAEIGIFKTDAFQDISPVFLDHLFFAFKYPSELITQGDIIFANTPYYKTLVNYNLDNDPKRSQAGFIQTKKIYSKYRNSFFHLLRLMKIDNDNDYATFMKHLDEFYKQRLLVALDLSIKDREFLEAFELASSIIGEFRLLEYKYEFETIKEFAILDYLEKYMLKSLSSNLIVLIDDHENSKKALIEKFFDDSTFQVSFNEINQIKNDVVFYVVNNNENSEIKKFKGHKIFYEEILAKKFS